MPGPFTHIYTARRVADLLGGDGPPGGPLTEEFLRRGDGGLLRGQLLDQAMLAGMGPKDCSAFMKNWPKFAAVGAIGPDLFFWLQDYNKIAIPSDEIMLAMSLLYYLDDQKRLDDPYDGLLLILAEVNDTWAGILRFIVHLDQIWQKFLKVWNDTIGPILDKVGQVIDDLSGGIFTALGDAFNELKNDVLNLVQQEFVSEGDVFGWFSLKMRNGYDEQAFLWSDMTHYRRTSIVPTRLMAHGRAMLKSDDPLTREHGEQLMAFALGWACHVGTDVIGHSFVNEQCGGPFRTHWQRHHLIENHIDAWNYQCTSNGLLPKDDFIAWQETYPSLADSALYFAVQIPQGIDGLPPDERQGDLRRPVPLGADKESQARRKELLDTDGELPLWLAETIVGVFIEVFADPAGEGGSNAVQGPLKEGQVPHPRNLRGQAFQDALHTGSNFAGIITKWMSVIDVDNVGVAFDDLFKQIAPDPPKTYPRGVPEGFPLPWQVQTAYRFMLSWFKRQYVATFDMDRPEPPTIFTPPASDFDFGPPDFGGVGSSDNPVSNACGDVLAVLDWLFKTLEKIAQLLYDIVKSILSAGTILPRELIYYGVTLPAWQAAENVRMVLVHLGYSMPQSFQAYPDGNVRRPNEIDETLITLGHSVDGAFAQALADAADPLGNLDKDPSLINVGVRDVHGALNPWLPVRVIKGGKVPGLASADAEDDVVEYLRPWAFPDRTNDPTLAAGNYIETPPTLAGPYLTDTMPDAMLSTLNPISNGARELYQDAGCPVDTDLYNLAFLLHQRSIVKDGQEISFRGNNPLGDPVVFSAYLIGQMANNPNFLSSFNLDADRGYGYLCWDWTRGEFAPNETHPKDGMLHEYKPPLTWPEGAGPRTPPPKPDGGVPFWVRPKPAPVGTNLYELAMLITYPGRSCVENPPDGGGPLK